MFQKKQKKNETNDKGEKPRMAPIIGESIKLQDVENFFKYAINPNLIEAKIEKATAAAIKDQGSVKNLIQYAFVFAIIAIAGVLAYNMFSGYQNNQDLNNKYISCVQQVAVCKQPVVSQQPSSQPQQQQSSGPFGLPIAIK